MSRIIKGATNWSRDPRTTRTAYWGVTTGVSVIVDTSKSWAGPSSIKLTMTTSKAATAQLFRTPQYTGTGDNQYVVVTEGDSVSVEWRLQASVAGKGVQAAVLFYNGSGTLLDTVIGLSTIVTNDVARWTKVNVLGAVAPAGATVAVCWIQLDSSTTLASGDIIWWSGHEVRINEEIDSFISGAEGTIYSWTGTADASPSKRADAIANEMGFRGGVTRITTEIWRSDINNTLLEDITDHFLAAEIDIDIDRLIKRKADFAFTTPDIVREYKDFVSVFITLQEEDKPAVRNQVGIFTVEIPSEEGSDEDGFLGGFTGWDLTWLLEETAPQYTYTIPAGTKYVDAARSIIASVGLRHAIPDDTRTVGSTRWAFPPGSTKLFILNSILQAIGYYNAWTTRDGFVTSMPYRDLLSANLFRTYTIGQDSTLLGAPVFDQNDETIRNIVIVVKDNPSGPPLKSFRVNKSVKSRTSTVNLGRERSRTVYDSQLTDILAVRALAYRLLQEAAVSVSADIETLPDPTMDPHQVCYLDFSGDSVLERHSGRYWIKGAVFGVTPQDGSMSLELRRVEDIS